ncbi:MAG: nucleotidyltransferase domain-containing protein [Candidatus Aenigmarchaeota archaeon]|nr:nucleotidyltransferase domain-containing protein [Candidatus Aenigmarchaeota archaeon]
MVNIYELKLTLLQQEILRLFFRKAGLRLNARAVARAAGVSQPAVSKALPALEKSGFLKVERDRETGRLSIELNRDSREVIWLKRADNLRHLYESGLVQYFYDRLPGSVVILFGSYAFGEDTAKSDIDIAVIGQKKEMETGKFEKMLERPVIINHYRSFKDIDKHLLNNILNGITLKGAVEL